MVGEELILGLITQIHYKNTFISPAPSIIVVEIKTLLQMQRSGS